MAVFKCKMCGGTLEINNETVAVCQYCGTKQTLPKLDDDRKANLYDRANHFRRNNEFDKAMGIYEQILNDDNTDAETYWSLVLCRYGIEYVEDPSSRKRIPTVNRAQFTSIFDDEDYKSALQYADGYQKDIYEQEATAINDIQKGILAISSQEEPFDVFICYKESDNSGRRTPDSVLATELYHELTREGYKVFFSRITLEDKLGTAYEPYIFAALNSAKVMVVLGTKPEFFNAVWVKNEWSRYLALIKNGARKMLIPAYKDMDPYDLPEEFSHLQAQDMSKLGFMQDLIRGIKKIVENNTEKQTIHETVIANEMSGNVTALLKRGYMALEDGEWAKADDFFEQCLNQNAELAEAYLGKLMAELHISRREDLRDCPTPFNNNSNFNKIIRFASPELATLLNDYIEYINNRNNLQAEEEQREKLYYSAMDDYKSYDISRLNNAIKAFSSLSDYKDSVERINLCKNKIDQIKEQAEKDRIEKERLDEEKRIDEANKAKTKKKKIKIFSVASVIAVVVLVLLFTLIIPSIKYSQAMKFYEAEEYGKAAILFSEAGAYKNSKDLKTDCWSKATVRSPIAGGSRHTVGLKSNGTVLYVGDREGYKDNVDSWNNIIALAVGTHHTVGLKSDGTVIATDAKQCDRTDVQSWKDIVAISAGGSHTVGLRSNGTVISTKISEDNKYSNYGQTNVSSWKNIIQVAAGDRHTIGLKTDGTVVATQYDKSKVEDYDGQCDVENWTDIIQIAAGFDFSVGLKSDGTVVTAGSNDSGQCNVSHWKNIKQIAVSYNHIVGLKEDGTVVVSGKNYYGEANVSSWNNIVFVAAGWENTIGLKSDGTAIATKIDCGDTSYIFDKGQSNVSSWNNIMMPTN